MSTSPVRLVHSEEPPETLEERLGRLEVEIKALIQAGKENFYQIGVRARQIRDEGLYSKVRGESNFETYCFATFGWHRDYVYKLIASTDISDILYTNGYKTDVTEGFVRPLTKLRTIDQTDPNQKKKIIDAEAVIECFTQAHKLAKQSGKGVAARHVAAVVRDYLGEEQSWLIKPSDNWNFSPVFYERIDGETGYGYIPGEVYANCLFYPG
jgi:hypothetical protein